MREGFLYHSIALCDEQGDLFVCRRDPPGNQISSDSIWIVVSDEIGVPEIAGFESNFNLAALRSLLTKQLGVGENVSEPAKAQTRPPLASNFRHAREDNGDQRSRLGSGRAC